MMTTMTKYSSAVTLPMPNPTVSSSAVSYTHLDVYKRQMLDKGEVDVDGKIDSLTYSENTGYGGKGESLFSRLFK